MLNRASSRNPLILSLNPMHFLTAFRSSFLLPYLVGKIFNFFLHGPLKFAGFMHVTTIG